MDRIVTGIVIAIAALVIGGLSRQSQAEERQVAAGPALSAPIPAVSGPSSERVLGLVLALEALRAAPDILDPAAGEQ